MQPGNNPPTSSIAHFNALTDTFIVLRSICHYQVAVLKEWNVSYLFRINRWQAIEFAIKKRRTPLVYVSVVDIFDLASLREITPRIVGGPQKLEHVPQTLAVPRSGKPGQPALARKKLLHRARFDVTLFSQKPLQGRNERVYIG